MIYVQFFSCSLVVIILWWLFAWRVRDQKTNLFVIGSTFLACIIIIWGSYVSRILPGSQILEDYSWTENVLGKGVWLEELLADTPERAFNGDGRSVYIFQIDKETTEHFENPPDDFFKSFPFKGENSNNHIKWTKTPIDEKEQNILDFSLNEYRLNRHLIHADQMDMMYLDEYKPRSEEYEKELAEYLANQPAPSIVHKILKEEGSYYAYWYRNTLEFPQNSTLYILSPKRRLFIAIFHDT